MQHMQERRSIHPGRDSLPHIHSLVERFGTDEQKRRLWRIVGEGGPGTSYRPMENAMFTQEALAIAIEMIGELQMEVVQLRAMVAGLTDVETRQASARSQEAEKG